MSDHSSTNQESSDQDGKRQESSGVEEIEDGYQTPTSEEHRPVKLRSPPPAPKKRKRLFLEKRSVGKVIKCRLVEGEELESFFADFLLPQSEAAAPPLPVAEKDTKVTTGPKKIRSDE